MEPLRRRQCHHSELASFEACSEMLQPCTPLLEPVQMLHASLGAAGSMNAAIECGGAREAQCFGPAWRGSATEVGGSNGTGRDAGWERVLGS